MKEPVYFMMGNDYLCSLEQWESENRWELEDDSQKRLGFQLPDLNLLSDKHKVSVIDESFFSHYMEKCFNNPDALFKKFITEVIPELEAVLFAALSQESHIECVLTWCNCPSLNAAAKRRNIKVVNLELGPLRSPEYLSTAYFDFSGVNGNTEAERRYLSSDYRFNMNAQVAQLREFFADSPPAMPSVLQDDEDRAEDKFDVGIALQVENDSNIIAFSNSFNNQSLLDYAEFTFPGRRLVRSHPGSRFTLQAGHDVIDHSANSIGFIHRCKHILTINSSVGLEAMLLDVPVTVLGDCSYAFCNVANQTEKVKRLAFYLFSYLVPFELLFDINYIRFRLSSPDEAEIITKHVNYYITRGDGMRDAEMEKRPLPLSKMEVLKGLFVP